MVVGFILYVCKRKSMEAVDEYAVVGGSCLRQLLKIRQLLKVR